MPVLNWIGKDAVARHDAELRVRVGGTAGLGKPEGGRLALQ